MKIYVARIGNARLWLPRGSGTASREGCAVCGKPYFAGQGIRLTRPGLRFIVTYMVRNCAISPQLSLTQHIRRHFSVFACAFLLGSGCLTGSTAMASCGDWLAVAHAPRHQHVALPSWVSAGERDTLAGKLPGQPSDHRPPCRGPHCGGIPLVPPVPTAPSVVESSKVHGLTQLDPDRQTIPPGLRLSSQCPAETRAGYPLGVDRPPNR